MTFPLVFHPDVRDEVDEAYQWYERKRLGLGDDFLAALDEVYHRLGATPKVHRIVYKDVRRALPRRFPYSVFYRVHPDRVEVIAVQHSHRDPRRWQSRV